MSESRFDRLKSITAQSTVARYAVISSFAQMIVQLLLESGVAFNHLHELKEVDTTTSTTAAANDLKSVQSAGTAITVYHVIFMLATLLQLYITLDSVLHQNSVELISLTILNVGLFGYAVMQFFQGRDYFGTIVPKVVPGFDVPTNVFHIPSIVVSLAFLVGTAALSYKLHQVYGWAIYKRIGADIGLRRQMMHYFFLMMLLKIDVFFYASFSLQFLVTGIISTTNGSSSLSTFEIGLHVVVSVVMIVSLYMLCVSAVRQEHSNLMLTFMAGTVCTMGYLVWKLIQVNDQTARFQSVKKSITFSIVFCLVLAVATTINAFVCYRNFGTGLKQHLGKQAGERRRAAARQASVSELAAGHGSGGTNGGGMMATAGSGGSSNVFTTPSSGYMAAKTSPAAPAPTAASAYYAPNPASGSTSPQPPAQHQYQGGYAQAAQYSPQTQPQQPQYYGGGYAPAAPTAQQQQQHYHQQQHQARPAGQQQQYQQQGGGY
ncbi:hypothetical protein BC828DRAFT_366062 [Blastocladiella britannica]|nr:hypothetical protein BC828DRAFT_366062 [Blastocladiella britannica]